MKYVLIFLSGILLLFKFSFSADNQPSARLPIPDSTKTTIKPSKSRIAFGQTVFNFGQVPRKTTLSHAFSYGVSSVDTVRIIRSSSSCSCTFANVPDKPLAPQDTGSIVITYTTGIVEGPFKKTFTLYTNSESTPEIELAIEGEVVRGVTTNPPVIHLDEVQLGGTWKQEVAITWTRWAEPGFKKSVKAPPFLYAGTFQRSKSDTTQWLLPVSLSNKAEAKYYQDTIVLSTSDTAWPQVTIPVQGTITDVVTTKPLVVNMGQIKIGQNISNSFVVVSSVANAKVESVKSSTGKIDATIGKTGEDGVTRINVATTKEAELGSVGTDVIVTVNVNGKRRELKVPVVGRFTE